MVAAQIVNSLQTIVSRNVNLTENPAVVTVGAIHSGNRFNVIPEQAEMIGTVRTFNDADETLVFNKVRLVAEKRRKRPGPQPKVELPYSVHYPVTFNNLELTDDMLPSLQKAAGKDNLVLMRPITGSEDFSFLPGRYPVFISFSAVCKGKRPAK